MGEIEELQKLAGNPGRLGMLCSIYSYNQEIVTNTAKLYEEFVIIILSKWEKKQNKKTTPKNRILCKYKDVVYQFGKLAYKQEDNGDLKLTFTMEDLEECISPELFNCGFMYKSHPLHRFEDCQVGFIQKSVQEYMAAYYISHEETGQAMDRLLKDFTTEERDGKDGTILKFAIYSGLSKEQIQHVFDYCIHSHDKKYEMSFVLLYLLDQYSLPLHQEPLFFGPVSYDDCDNDDDINCFVQLPACIILTYLSESTFKSRWRGIKQSDDQKSWILTWPSDIKIIFIIDHIPDDKDDCDLDDENTGDMTEEYMMMMIYLHKSPLLITGESENVTHLLFNTTENTQVHVSSVCKNVTNVYLHSKLHSQVKWLNNLLLDVPNCKKLNMKSCGLSDEDIKHLCEETKGRVLNTEILNLENNNVITEGPDDLVRFVRQCPRLRKLYLKSDNMTETQHEDLVMELYNRIEKGLWLYINDDDDDDDDDVGDYEVVTPGAVGDTEDCTNTDNIDIRNDKPDNTEDTVRYQEKEIKKKEKKKCVLM